MSSPSFSIHPQKSSFPFLLYSRHTDPQFIALEN
jgi:hypothetical protein